MAIASVNPATGELLKSFEPFDPERVETCLRRAEARLESPSALDERLGWLTRAADLLEEDKERLARLMTTEMGKPLRAARAEIEKSAWVCRYYAEHAGEMLAEESVEVSADVNAYIRHEPLGIILAIMPFNFPFWQVFRFAAPALAAGNVALLKHAPSVPQCALAIEEIFERAGFPEGSFQTLLVDVEPVAALIADERIAAVTLTGSDRAGAEVASIAGRHVKKVVLELGGSDPFIVMPSADLDEAAEVGAMARVINTGQSCVAAKRFIVHEAAYDAFVDKLVASLRKIQVGDPFAEETDIGPLAAEHIRDGVERQVNALVRAGARLLLGGERREGSGFFYPPTVLADVKADIPTSREEIFGPVASIYRARDIEDAIRLANDTPFGLGASVWTQDEAEQRRFIEKIEAGLVFVNAMVASDPRLPFGGVKRSGYGRELGPWGMREWVNVKTVWLPAGRGSRREKPE